MKNKILQGYLSDFQNDFNFSEKREDILFEHFCNYCIISKVHPEAFYDDSFKIEDINVGGGQDTGIDGIAIIVNDHLVSSIEEIDSLKDSLQRLDVRFIFTQSKTSDEFKSSEIGNFIYGVKDFFKDKPTLKTSEDILHLRSLKEYIYNKSILMDEPPLCELYYITTGKWLKDQNVNSRIVSDTKELRNQGLFKDVAFNPIDAENIERIYKEIKNKITKEINFEKNVPLPRIEGVQESYVGILSLKEYFNLILDSEGKLQRSIFYDNVRDFLGINPVNLEIQNTLRNKENQYKFPILNNGITVVAKSLNKVGTYYKVKDFQVVNGCQTSNILYANKNNIDEEKIFVPFKLIVTDNQEVINDITKATNRQTEIKIEAFESLKEFHKKLQTYYDSYPKESKIYYERRPREYDSVFPSIPRARIITLSAQINSVISMFWNEPQSTHRYYGELLKSYSGKLFLEDHNPCIYYTSSYCLYVVDTMIKRDQIPSKYRHFKYHILTVLRILISGFNYPKFNSKDISRYCDNILASVQNLKKMETLIKTSTTCIDNALLTYNNKYGKKNIHDYKRLKDFTYELIEQAKKLDPIYHKGKP